MQDDVVIGDNVTASHALLCQGVTVCSGATLQPGVVLSYGVVIGPRHTVPSHTTITLCKQLQGQVRVCACVCVCVICLCWLRTCSNPQLKHRHVQSNPSSTAC